MLLQHLFSGLCVCVVEGSGLVGDRLSKVRPTHSRLITFLIAPAMTCLSNASRASGETSVPTSSSRCSLPTSTVLPDTRYSPSTPRAVDLCLGVVGAGMGAVVERAFGLDRTGCRRPIIPQTHPK